MLTTLRTRRLVAPALLTGLLATTALSIAPEAAAAAPVEAPVAAPVGATAATPVEATATGPERTAPYGVVPGISLKAKPPPWVLPVTGYHLTGRFGDTSGLWATTHTGLDFAAAEGVEIRSIASGVVTAASSDGSFGNKTVVRLDDGTVLWYCHQSAFGVKVGQRLAAGDLLGYIGSTGNVTGPHLHFEVHPGGGDPVDPETWLAQHDLQP